MVHLFSFSQCNLKRGGIRAPLLSLLFCLFPHPLLLEFCALNNRMVWSPHPGQCWDPESDQWCWGDPATRVLFLDCFNQCIYQCYWAFSGPTRLSIPHSQSRVEKWTQVCTRYLFVLDLTSPLIEFRMVLPPAGWVFPIQAVSHYYDHKPTQCRLSFI